MRTDIVIAFFLSVLIFQCDAQIDCELNNVVVTLISIEGAILNRGTSEINSARAGGVTRGDTLELTAVRCGEISFEVSLSYDWVNGFEDDAWLHGISFLSSNGWSSGEAGSLGPGWEYYDSMTGCCSGNTYYDGYFYEDEGFASGSHCDGSNGCCDVDDFNCVINATSNEDPDDPSDSWGIDCEFDVCPDFSFKLTYCPSETGRQVEEFGFVLTNDGDSGGWTLALGCFYELKFPIIINAAGIPVEDDSSRGPDCPGTCYELFAGDSCDDYLWSTGETTEMITVCPEVDTSYFVTVQTSCGAALFAEYPILVESCCAAEAGTVVDTIVLCPNESYIPSVFSDNMTDPFVSQLIIFNALDSLVVHKGSPDSVWSYDGCGDFIAFNFNFDSTQDLDTLRLGQKYEFYDCANSCCDYSDTIHIQYYDVIAPTIELPAEIIVSDLIDYDSLYSLPLAASYIDNCLGTGSILPSVSGIADLCNGGCYEWTYLVTDSCGNSTIELLEIFIPPSQDCSCLSLSPPVEQNFSTCLSPNSYSVSVSSIDTELLVWYDSSQGGTQLGYDVASIEVSISAPGNYTYYVENVSLVNSDCVSVRIPVSLEVYSAQIIYDFDLDFCIDNSQTFITVDEQELLAKLDPVLSYEFYLTEADREERINKISFPYNHLINNNTPLLGLLVDENLCTSNFETNINLNLLIGRDLEILLCQGDSLLYNGDWLFESGTYGQLISGLNDCDTIETLTLDIVTGSVDTLDIAICSGDSILINAAWITTAGIYPEVYKNVYGCDSIVHNRLTTNQAYISTSEYKHCEGDSVFFDSKWLYQEGLYTESYKTVHGCDSLELLDLVVEKPDTINSTATICRGDSIYFVDNWVTDEGFYSANVIGLYCDTLKTIELLLVEEVFENIELVLCDGDTFELSNTVISSEGIFLSEQISSSGCDSITFYEVTGASKYIDTLSVLACTGDSLFFNGETYTNTGLYSQDFLSVQACDSIIYYDLTFNESYNRSEIIELCSGDTLSIGSEIFVTSDSYTEELVSISGCDSLINYTIIVHPEYNEAISSLICEGDTLYFENQTITEAGIYSLEYITVQGCDSLVTVEMELANPNIVSIADTTVTPGTVVEFDLELEPLEWEVTWSPEGIAACPFCLQTSLSPNDNTEVSVFLTELSSGCSQEISFNIIVESNFRIYIPNVINTNNSLNNNWMVYSNADFRLLDCVIYDRWGSPVYEIIGNEPIIWDGKVRNEKAQQGVYTYVIRLEIADEGVIERFVGDITLIR